MAQKKFIIDGGFETNADSTVSGTLTISAPSANTHAATKLYVDTSIANVIDSAPGALDTLNELAAALGDDANFAGSMTTQLATKADSTDLTALETRVAALETILTNVTASNGGIRVDGPIVSTDDVTAYGS